MYRPPPSILRKSAGAFDLPSIITGVVVVGILAAGVLAAIFGVIPFAQDRGAKQDLSSIRTAEGVAKAKDNRFMDHQRLLDIGYLQLSSTEKTKVKADAKGTCYVGIAKSGTGTLFYSTDADTDPAILEADTDTGCLTDEELAELIADIGGIEEDDTANGAPKNLKFTAVSPLQAKATWDPVKKASGYKVEYRVGEATEWIVKAEKTTATSTNISALPEETVSVKVYALTGESVSEPSTASVRLPDAVLKNPSFELGVEGWTISSSQGGVTSTKPRTGTKSVLMNSNTSVAQTVTVPAGTPVLTYWATGAPEFRINGTRYTPVRGAEDSGWYQHRMDLSGFAGKTTTITFIFGSGYIDDVTLEAPMVSFAPVSAAASSNNGTATVTWGTPPFSGGTPVTSYTATAWLDGKEQASTNVAPDKRTAIVQGLKVGTEYTFTVHTNNAVGVSEPGKSGPVVILAGAIANPSFELGAEGWTISSSQGGVTSVKSRTGTKSALMNSYTSVAQTVTVPAGTPVLTYWATGAPEFRINSATYTPARGTADSGWYQHHMDLSGFAGKTITLTFIFGSGHIDDVTLEAPMVSSAPVSAAASSNNGTATVTWGTPPFSGGTPVTSYTATAWLDGKEQASTNVAPDKRTAIVQGLKVGTEYTFTVHTNNAVGVSEPGKTGPVVILAGAIANPSFELGAEGWTISSSQGGVTSTKPRTGTKSVLMNSYTSVAQTVTVPAGTPVLTYWATGAPEFRINGVTNTPARGAEDSGWYQYRMDLSGFAGKTTTITFIFGSGHIDDITLEAPIAAFAPTTVAASSSNGTATVTWAPAFAGGTPITSFTATAWRDGKEQASVDVAPDKRTAIVQGLKVGTEYTFTVHANNAVGVSEPGKSGPVVILAGAIANPSFELGAEGWTISSSKGGVTSTKPHTGTKSVLMNSNTSVAQTVTVPAGTPVLTYWATGAPEFRINGTRYTPVRGTADSGWYQHRMDLSGFAGKTTTITFIFGSGYIDDVTLEAK